MSVSRIQKIMDTEMMRNGHVLVHPSFHGDWGHKRGSERDKRTKEEEEEAEYRFGIGILRTGNPTALQFCHVSSLLSQTKQKGANNYQCKLKKEKHDWRRKDPALAPYVRYTG